MVSVGCTESAKVKEGLVDLIAKETELGDGPPAEEDGSEAISCCDDCALDLVGGGKTVI